MFTPASSHLASQVGRGNAIAALRGAAEQQMAEESINKEVEKQDNLVPTEEKRDTAMLLLFAVMCLVAE